MGRHSKNNNDRAFFTYHERQAARKGYASSAFYKHANSAYGGGELKIGSDSLRDFDACCLSLHPCRDPVITPQGYLFEREVIYEYILQKRKDNERALQAWAAQEAADAAGTEQAQRDTQQRVLEAFESGERGLAGAGTSTSHDAPPALTSGKTTGASSRVRGHVVNDDVRKHATDLNFWTPQNAPIAAQRVAKPDTTIRCPMSGEPLRLKQLVSVKFTPADLTDDQAKLESMKPNERYVDPITHKPLSNGVELLVLRPSGTVVTRDTVTRAIKKDMLDPFCEPPAKLKEKDMIPIISEGTGFAQRGNTEVKKQGAMPTY